MNRWRIIASGILFVNALLPFQSYAEVHEGGREGLVSPASNFAPGGRVIGQAEAESLLGKELNLFFSKSRKSITVVYTNRNNGKDKVLKTLPATCNILPRTEPNATTTPNSGTKQNYFPSTFPEGKSKITAIKYTPDASPTSYGGQIQMKTNATQNVNTYTNMSAKDYTQRSGDGSILSKDKNTVYVPNATQQKDAGYNIHDGGTSINSTTLGCIRTSNESMKYLSTVSAGQTKAGQNTYLYVR